MGFNFGAFAGGLAQGGLDTYTRLSDLKRQQEEHEFRKQQQQQLKDMQAALAGVEPGKIDPSAEQKGGIPLSQLQATNPDAYDYAKAAPGQQFTITPPPAPAGTALPAGTPAPTPQQYTVYTGPDKQLYATTTPTLLTPEAANQRRSEIMLNSGLPDYARLGLDMQRDAREREQFNLEQDARRMRLGVGQAWLHYQQTGDLAGAINMATKPFNDDTKYTGNYKVEWQPTNDGRFVGLYRNDKGEVVYSNPPKAPLDIFSELAGATDPQNLLTLRNTISDIETRSRQLDQGDKRLDLEGRQVDQGDKKIRLEERQVAVQEGNAKSEAGLRTAQQGYYDASGRRLNAEADLLDKMRDPDPKVSSAARAAYMAMHGKAGANGGAEKLSLNPNYWADTSGPEGYVTSASTPGQPGTAMLFGRKVLGGIPLKPEYWYGMNATLAQIPPELRNVIHVDAVDGVPRYSAKLGNGKSATTNNLEELIDALSKPSAPQGALPTSPK
jgi:hypothetical protein